MDRRRFLVRSATLGLGLGFGLSRRLVARPRFPKNPFALGVASGDVTEQAAVLWTRLATEPMASDGGIADAAIPVRWQLATDREMKRVLHQGEALAVPELAHSVHIDVQGLRPATYYWYRFTAGAARSPIGRTKTLPALRGPVTSLRFASACCQHYEQGFFAAYRHMVDDDPDFVLHLGDYIYDVSFGPGVRQHETPEAPATLEAFRRRHALYRLDPDLQAAHAALPFFLAIDNHDALEFNDPKALAKRAAAYQAWYEHMPIRAPVRLGSAAMSLYQTIDAGPLASLYLLDTRQFRDDQNIGKKKADPNFAFGVFRPDCEARLAADRTLLGAEQNRWLAERFRRSRSTWNVIASTVAMSPLDLRRGQEPYVYYGSWDGYPENRRRVLAAITESGLSNPVVVSGDVHSSWACDLRHEIEGQPRMIASEFIGTSLSSGWPSQLSDPVTASLSHNPHVRFYDGAHRGYLLHDISSERWLTRMRGVENVSDPRSGIVDVARFVVENGRPGPRQA